MDVPHLKVEISGFLNLSTSSTAILLEKSLNQLQKVMCYQIKYAESTGLRDQRNFINTFSAIFCQ
jgi:hypothetical protein